MRRQEVPLFGTLALMCGSSFVALGLYAVGLIAPSMHHAYAGSAQASLVPWVATVAGPVFALASPLAGAVIDRLGYRRVYIVSIILFVTFGILPHFLDDLRLVLLARTLLGFAVAGAVTAALAGIGSLAEKDRPTVFGLANFLSLGVLVAVFPIIGLMVKSGWHLPFLIYLLGLIVLPLAIMLPQSPARAGPVMSPEPVGAETGLLARYNPFLVLFAGTLGLSIYIAQIYTPMYLATIGVSDPARASLILTMMTSAAMFSSVTYGRVHRRLGTSATFVLIFLLVAIGFGVCSLSRSTGLFAAGGCCLGAGVAFALPNCFTWAMQNSDASPGRAGAFVNVAAILPQALFPLIEPTIRTLAGPTGVFRAFAILCLFWAIWFVIETRRPVPDARKVRAMRVGAH